MTAHETYAPRALERALIEAVGARLRAPEWRAQRTDWGVDWHHERADARVTLRPGVMVVYRRGARVLYMESPRALGVEDALARAGVIAARGRAASVAGRARIPRGARAGAGAPWAGAGGRGSGGS